MPATSDQGAAGLGNRAVMEPFRASLGTRQLPTGMTFATHGQADMYSRGACPFADMPFSHRGHAAEGGCFQSAILRPG